MLYACGLLFYRRDTKSNLAILEFNNVNIKVNDDSMMSLTDLWEASGKTLDYNPYNWGRKDGSAFVDAVAKKLKGCTAPLLQTTRGRTGGTFGHWQIALAYAKYLSPELHMHVNEVYKERLEETANPELSIAMSFLNFGEPMHT